MSEKRFTFDDEVEFEIFDKETGQHYDGRIGHQKTLCILLNELAEENEQLRQKLDFYLLDEFEWKEKYGD